MSSSSKLTVLTTALLFVGCGAMQGSATPPRTVTENRLPHSAFELNELIATERSPDIIIGPTENIRIMSLSMPSTLMDSFRPPWPRGTVIRASDHPQRQRQEPDVPNDVAILGPVIQAPRHEAFDREKSKPSEPQDDFIWMLVASVSLALALSRIAKSGARRVGRSLLTVLMYALVVVLSLWLIVIGAALVPTAVFYLVVREATLSLDRLVAGLQRFCCSAWEYIVFLFVPSKGPWWMTSGKWTMDCLPSDAAIRPMTPPTPVPPAAPAAWQGDRELHESWADDEEDIAPAAKQGDEMIPLIALLRIQEMRRDFQGKLAELDELEDKLRRNSDLG